MAWENEVYALGACQVSFKRETEEEVTLGITPEDSEVSFTHEEETVEHGGQGIDGALATVITGTTTTVEVPLYVDLESLAKLAPHKLEKTATGYKVKSAAGQVIEPIKMLITPVGDTANTILFNRAMPSLNFEIVYSGEGKAKATVSFKCSADLTTKEIMEFGGSLA